jgi:thioredoxin-dependent peroxiredoxin
MAAPQVGDIAPDFTLDGTDGRFALSDHRGERVVLLFYPGDFTPVCTKQMCSYSDRWEDFSKLDATVVGISAQSVERHHQFKSMHGIPMPLLADQDRSVAKSYGVSQPILGTRRAVFIVDEDGRIAYRHVHLLGIDFQTVDELQEALSSVSARS